MPNNTTAIVSAVLTAIVLVIFAVLFLLVQMVVLNGASEGQGVTAMGIALACQGVVVLLAAGFAAWTSRLLITRFNWNKILVVLLAVLVGTVSGGLASFLFTIIAIPLAGIR